MQRRTFLKNASVCGLSFMLPAPMMHALEQGQAAPSQPNILLIVSDQHRAGLSKRHGYPLDTSPTLDKLAAGGVAFDRAYCSSPLCVPSRISMLTGRWPDATRVRTNAQIRDGVYPSHLYRVAKEQGYRTGLAGKNHTFLKPSDLDFWREYELASGWIPPNAPAEYHAFDKWMRGLHAHVALEPNPFPLELQYPYRIVSDAIEFMSSAGQSPFLLQVSFSEPHDPEQVPAPYWNMFPPESVPDRVAGPEALAQLGDRARWEFEHQEAAFANEKHWRRYKSNYLGMLRLLDDQLARLLSFMEGAGLLRNTIILYTADHGDYLMDYGLARKGVGLPECLTHIPMVWSGPGIVSHSAGQEAFVSNIDLFPTLCEAMHTSIPRGVQGRSLWPLLQGQPFPSEEFRSIYATVGVGGLYYESSDHIPPIGADAVLVNGKPAGFDELNKVTLSGLEKMVRMGDFKLIFDAMGNGQLYHLPTDPGELKNLYGKPEFAAQQAALTAELLMWTIRANDDLPTGPQGAKFQTKWPAAHNWYAPHRHGAKPGPWIP